MFTNSSLRNFQESTYRTAVMSIITVVIRMFLLFNDDISFDKTWLIKTLSKIVGFGLYDLFLYKIVENSKFKSKEKEALQDILYFGCVLYMKEYIMSSYQERDFNTGILKNFTLMTISFTVYHLFLKSRILKLSSDNEKNISKSNSDFLNFSKKIFFGVFISNIIPLYGDRKKLIKQILPDLFVMII